MINRRKFLTNSAAAVVGVAVGAGVARRAMEHQGSRTARQSWKNLNFASNYASDQWPPQIHPKDGIRKGDMLYYSGGNASGRSDLMNWAREIPIHVNYRCKVVRV